MKTLLLAAVAAIALGAGAQAQAAGAVGGFIAGGVAGAQGQFASTTTNVYGSGNGNASSASGTNFTAGAGNGGALHYSSNGQGFSSVTMTPEGAQSFSAHNAVTNGWTTPGASFNATNETFGQSIGNVAFNSNQTTKEKSFDVSGYKVVGAVGGFTTFGNYEGGNMGSFNNNGG